eukprot:GEMP01101692.1.p1 GENE.GEMP01101692.1~~GEMP01101692.1.p1  ORF type:complete len:112 (+),score=10.45 GEMP01101692.1:285-620(+)
MEKGENWGENILNAVSDAIRERRQESALRKYLEKGKEYVDFIEGDYSSEEIKAAIRNLKKGRMVGEGKIPGDIFIEFNDWLAPELSKIFNNAKKITNARKPGKTESSSFHK